MRRVESVMQGLLLALVAAACAAPATCLAQQVGVERVNVRVVADEAEAVLAILAKRVAGQAVTEEDWRRLFESEGYVRLKRRELSMHRAFDDVEFKTFVLSDQLAARFQALSDTLARWKKADASDAARRALAYLPKDAYIRAKIYPVIKPRENSFVFDLETDPAIFLYLDPTESREIFENKLAHELHHIGYGTACPSKRTREELAHLPQNVQTVILWLGAFGEGFAMLAAAGGPNVHPHAWSRTEDRARWDKDVANFDADLRRVEKFFQDILDNRLSEEERNKVAASFYGIQGPWYTVGWKMAVTIERADGRAKLIECMCDQRKLLRTYNQAAAKFNHAGRERLALWSSSFLKAIAGTGE